MLSSDLVRVSGGQTASTQRGACARKRNGQLAHVGPGGETVESSLMTIGDVAELLSCSTRHVRRLTDAGRMPAPVRLGRLLRWRDLTGDPMTGLRDWLADGCPSCRLNRRAGR